MYGTVTSGPGPGCEDRRCVSGGVRAPWASSARQSPAGRLGPWPVRMVLCPGVSDPGTHAAGHRAHGHRSLPSRHGRAGSEFQDWRSCLLKISGANELGEPTGSQRPPASGHARPRPATVVAGRCHTGPRLATSSDGTSSPYKRGAAGSNPAAPTVLAGQTHAVINEMIVREPNGEPNREPRLQMILFVVGGAEFPYDGRPRIGP
jgi:hypothetical protein